MITQICTPRDKFELRAYLESFNLHDLAVLEANADEITANIRRVMQPYVDGEHRDSLKEYYEPAVELVNKAYASKHRQNFHKMFSDALDFMIDSIEWE